tara:strand:- start:183 stop:2807 length:2625 start_codon:yes stop_codon:yes gene_type:complete
MDSFKFGASNYQQVDSLVDAQNKVIEALKKDNAVMSQDRANYAKHRASETQRQLNQLQNIIAGIPKLKANLEKAKEKKAARQDRQEALPEKPDTETPDETKTGIDSYGRQAGDKNFNQDPKKTGDDDSAKINKGLTDALNNKNVDDSTKNVIKSAFNNSFKVRTGSGRSNQAIAADGQLSLNQVMGEGQGYRLLSEHNDSDKYNAFRETYLQEKSKSEWYQGLSEDQKDLWYKSFSTTELNFKNQAARHYISKTDAEWKDTRAYSFFDDLNINPGNAIQSYIYKFQTHDGKKDTRKALEGMIGEFEYLEKKGVMKADMYRKILSSEIDFFNKKTKVKDLNNFVSEWVQSRVITLSHKENVENERRYKIELQNDLEASEIKFEQWQKENNPKPEEESNWRQNELKELYKRNPKILPGDPLYAEWINGMTRLDGPDHSITLQRLVDDYRNDTPLDDTMYNELPQYWKNQFQKAIGGTDGQEGSTATGKEGSGKLTFKSMFNPISNKGPWEAHVSDKLGETDIEKSKTVKWHWIVQQGKEDWIDKFKEFKPNMSVEDAQQAAFNYIRENYQKYKENPIDTGFDPKFIVSITEGRADLLPRISGASLEEREAILTQPTFWDGEEVAYKELVKFTQGYAPFPQYYRQVDFFKDMTPRDIALKRMEIHKSREEKSEAFDNAYEAILKGAELDNKLFNSLPFETSRLLTNHNTAGRTYRAEVQEKDNPELFEHIKTNDDPNAYTPINPYSDHVPERNLSEMSLNDVFREARDKRLSNFGLYSLTPKNILDVLSKEEETNGFLDTIFDEELQTELKRRLARLAANKGNQTGALVENPNPLPNLIPEDSLTLTEMFGPQDWFSIPPNILQEYLKELQEEKINY